MPVSSALSVFLAEPKGRTDNWGGSSSFKRFCLNSCPLHTFPHLPSQEKDFSNELHSDNRPLINSLLFFWGYIILSKVSWGKGWRARTAALLDVPLTLAPLLSGITAPRPFLVTLFSWLDVCFSSMPTPPCTDVHSCWA